MRNVRFIGEKMVPKFETANMPIFDQKMTVPLNEFRYVALTNAGAMTLRHSRHVEVTELTNASTQKTKKILSDDIDRTCPFYPTDMESACRKLQGTAGFRLRKFQQFLQKGIPNTRIFAVIGKQVGQGNVKVFSGNKQKQWLLVHVVKTIKVSVAFFPVSHLVNNKQIPHSSIDKKRIEVALGYVNTLFRQAAIEVTLSSFEYAKVKSKLNAVVDVTDKKTMM